VGVTPAAASDTAATSADATFAGEPASENAPHDGAARPRRRRRRRRKPVEARAAAGAAENAEAQSGASVDQAAQADAGEGEARRDTGGEAGAEAAPEGAPRERPILRLRSRRRRRRRPQAPGLLPGPLVAPDSAAGGPEAPGDAVAATSSGEAAAIQGQQASGEAPAARPARPRNRRRRVTPPGSAAGDTGERRPREAGAPARTGAPSSPGNRAGERQHGDRRPQGERGNAARQGAPRETGRDGVARTNPRVDPRGDQRGPRRDQGRGPRRDGPPGRGRDGPPRRAERQLYSFDSVVDRGFEDVEEEGAETRRVHWTIVKRTTADQVSRKPVSAVYVVQRDGADSEFPNLGTARSAVNKTIVHPEKLTPSKAEIAALKK
jgi:hypothetical protein